MHPTHHKFVVGQVVRRQTRLRLKSEGEQRYVIVQRMPVEHGALTYKIRSVSEGVDRIADESELTSYTELTVGDPARN